MGFLVQKSENYEALKNDTHLQFLTKKDYQFDFQTERFLPFSSSLSTYLQQAGQARLKAEPGATFASALWVQAST